MRKLRILFVTGIFPPDHGGPASYVPAIASALAQRHVIQGVITLSDVERYDDSGYPFPVVRIYRRQIRLLRSLKVVLMIWKLARRADVVYLNGLVLEGIIACKILGRKKVAIKVVGDLIWEKARNARITRDSIDAFQNNCSHGLKLQFLKKLQRWYTAQADCIITPSRYLSMIVSNWGVTSDKISVIYNAAESYVSETQKQVEPEYDLVTVARLIELKKLDIVIKIASDLGLKYLIVGDGPMFQEWTDLSNRLHADVTFCGHVRKDVIPNYIRKGKIFILNSIHEGLPHVIQEAKAVGVPVIATSVGGTPEIIYDGVDGYLVQFGDIEALTGKIKYLLENPAERQRIGSAGREQVLEQFSFETMVARTEQVLAAVCNCANGGY